MEHKPKVDLSSRRMPKMSSKYWVKMFLYALVLGALFYWFKTKTNEEPKMTSPVHEIRNVEIEI